MDGSVMDGSVVDGSVLDGSVLDGSETKHSQHHFRVCVDGDIIRLEPITRPLRVETKMDVSQRLQMKSLHYEDEVELEGGAPNIVWTQRTARQKQRRSWSEVTELE
ncbi:hypothetical protein NHX12_030710 [Muraenolepis orangiensis]|uniref:Uncharacterized protein n=1 Tax=Muraenolepis orangiensis TaxID=630683 RepID=A0A9Q0IN48_9TELE|nr:hypothetical protein NHX12_030710 [Muraenolepis orangiensis]